MRPSSGADQRLFFSSRFTSPLDYKFFDFRLRAADLQAFFMRNFGVRGLSLRPMGRTSRPRGPLLSTRRHAVKSGDKPPRSKDPLCAPPRPLGTNLAIRKAALLGKLGKAPPADRGNTALPGDAARERTGRMDTAMHRRDAELRSSVCSFATSGDVAEYCERDGQDILQPGTRGRSREAFLEVRTLTS